MEAAYAEMKNPAPVETSPSEEVVGISDPSMVPDIEAESHGRNYASFSMLKSSQKTVLHSESIMKNGGVESDIALIIISAIGMRGLGNTSPFSKDVNLIEWQEDSAQIRWEGGPGVEIALWEGVFQGKTSSSLTIHKDALHDSHTCSSWRYRIIASGGEDSFDCHLSDVHIFDDILVWCARLNALGHMYRLEVDLENGIWTKVIATGGHSSAGESLDRQLGGVLLFICGCNKNLEMLNGMPR
ncbi:unnamed protein product [Fraxinus pennsylvanica]|uniref:Uncharacterized protein n=1 Tax=Fraxinus pennsylvanica TaxID=56036 RepID=A0AAD2E7U4_9LAMI|nr:unnamed protein product [Fraxinus pennsylvanica]